MGSVISLRLFGVVGRKRCTFQACPILLSRQPKTYIKKDLPPKIILALFVMCKEF